MIAHAMDGLAPRTRRPDRSMVSFVPARPSDRHVPGTGPIRTPERASHARAAATPDDASMTLGRRIGVLVVLAALAGAIILAANGGRGDRPSGVVAVAPASVAVVATQPPAVDAAGVAEPAVVGAPTGRPTLVEPKTTLVNQARANLRVRVPDPGVPWDGLELRVLRGGTPILSRPVGPDDIDAKGRVTLKGVPLKRGTNKLAVVLANPSGAGPASDVLTMRLDDRPPRLKLTAPRDGTTLNQDAVTVRGRTVAGIRVVVRNMTTDQKVVAFADGEGRFSADLRLKRGRATIKVAVADAAGNQSEEKRVIVRGNGKPEARLALSRDGFRHAALPRSLDARVTVLDADGRPIKGAEAVFSIAPPGLPTRQRTRMTSKDGVATWSGFRVVEDAVAGDGLVTVLVTLPDGRQLRDVAEFTISGR